MRILQHSVVDFLILSPNHPLFKKSVRNVEKRVPTYIVIIRMAQVSPATGRHIRSQWSLRSSGHGYQRV